MLIPILLFIVGTALLIKGADYFVEASSKIAKHLKVSDFVIGLTLVAIGTSLPELASSIYAAFIGSTDLVIGNVIGSNIANIFLILGVCSLFAIVGNDGINKREWFVLALVSLLFGVFISDLRIDYIDGIFLLILFIAYTLHLISLGEEGAKKNVNFRQFLDSLFMFFKFTNKKEKRVKKDWKFLSRQIFIITLCLVAIYFGAKLMIDSSIEIGTILGLSQAFIGLTIVALGTSLPELAVSIISVRKGMSDIMLGNIIGSNISNILLVVGATSMIKPLSSGISTLYIALPFMLLATGSLYMLMRTKHHNIKKGEGIMFLFLYIAFIVLSFFF